MWAGCGGLVEKARNFFASRAENWKNAIAAIGCTYMHLNALNSHGVLEIVVQANPWRQVPLG